METLSASCVKMKLIQGWQSPDGLLDGRQRVVLLLGVGTLFSLASVSVSGAAAERP